AELVMDGDESQFAVMYPKFAAHRQEAFQALTAEIARQIGTTETTILQKAATITDDDPTVKVFTGASLRGKVFDVPMAAGQIYTIALDSKDLDAFIILQDATGKELASDDDGGGGLNALLTYAPPDNGPRKVWAACVKGTGNFHLRITAVSKHDAKEVLAKRQA